MPFLLRRKLISPRNPSQLSFLFLTSRSASRKVSPKPSPKYALKAKAQDPSGHYFRGDKKLKIVPHAYYTDALFDHGEIDVGAETKKEYIKRHLKQFRYPVAEWNDLGYKGNGDFSPADHNEDFHNLTSAVYGPLLTPVSKDSSQFIVTDFSKGHNTHDIDQQVYGDLITPTVVSRLDEKGDRRLTKAAEKLKSSQKPVKQVVTTAYQTPDDDQLLHGPRLASVSGIKGLESVEESVVSDMEVRLAAKKSTMSPESLSQMREISTTMPLTDPRNPKGWYGAQKKTPPPPVIPRQPAVLIPQPADATLKLQTVQLQKEGDLKALPQAPMMNKLRPNYLEDANKINLPGAVVLKICPEALLGQPLSPEKYPSVTTVLDVTMAPDSRARLEAWKARKIVELGEEGFKLYQQNVFADGKGFHTAVESVLNGMKVSAVPVAARNQGHWQSLQHVFKDISNVVSVEEKINHPFLCYKGVTDCVISLEGQQSLVEWKTSSTRKDTVLALYDNPIQVAAYMGAVNFDEKFADRKLQVSRGAVVVAYDTGEPASVVHFDYNLMRHYWALWLKRLHQFWRLASIEKSLPLRKW